MMRTQIQLTEHQWRELHRLSAERHVSMASLVREAVDTMLGGDDAERRWERALAVVGRFAETDGVSDVAAAHDRYLDEAWGH